MLKTKVTSEWHTLPPEARSQFVSAISQQLQALASKPESILAARRLCLVLAAAGVRSGANESQQLVQQAIDISTTAGSQHSTPGTPRGF